MMHKTDKSEILIGIENLKKDFVVGNETIHALRGIDLEIMAQEFLVIFGPSGCGKSTLLNIILGLDRPTHGKIRISDRDIFALSEDGRGLYRSRKIGMVHQMPYWVKTLTVLENIAMPLIIRGLKQKSATERARQVVIELGIEELSGHYPTQLSGGQQQRAGVARAIVADPWIVIADEPTGNLDSKGAQEVINMLSNLNKLQKKTIILVTHNEDYWEIGTRRIEMKDGKIIRDIKHG